MMRRKIKALLTSIVLVASCHGQAIIANKKMIYNFGKDVLLNTFTISEEGIMVIANEQKGISTYRLNNIVTLNKHFNALEGFVGEPTFNDSGLLIPHDNSLICYGMEGKVKWIRSFSDRAKAGIKAIKDKIYIQVRGEGIYCLKSDDGSVLWFKPSIEGTIGGLFVNEKFVVVSGLGDSVLCLNATNGNLVWSNRYIGAIISDVSCNTKVLAVNVCQLVGGGKSSMKMLSLDSGHLISEVSLEANCRYKPLLNGQVVYTGTEDSKIIAYNNKTSQKVWECKLPDSDVLATNLIVKDDGLYLGSAKRRFIKISLRDGRVLASSQYEYGFSNLFMWNNSIYFAIGNGDLIKYE